jgi:hypothetical protein
LRESSTLYSQDAGVFMSPCREPSIITLVKPERIEAWHTAGLAP